MISLSSFPCMGSPPKSYFPKNLFTQIPCIHTYPALTCFQCLAYSCLNAGISLGSTSESNLSIVDLSGHSVSTGYGDRARGSAVMSRITNRSWILLCGYRNIRTEEKHVPGRCRQEVAREEAPVDRWPCHASRLYTAGTWNQSARL